MLIDEFIQNLPKAELNLHIEGTLEPELMLELAKRNRVVLPYTTIEAAKAAYKFQDLKAFLEVYYMGIKVLITERDFYDLTMAYLRKAATQNIRHTEISFDPQAHLDRGIEFKTVINGIYQAMQDGKNQLNISSHLIMCIMRNLTEDDAQKVFDQALEFKDWIVAIGLDGAEIDNPPEKFKEVFARARDQGFLTVAIAGEVGPPEYIWQALEILKVSRIDHGVRCMEDPDLVTRLAATQIPLNVCPISNVKLGIFPSMRQHPLKRMYEEGLFVTVNSDNPSYFGAYLNENFIAANAALKLNKTIIFELAKNSFTASFLEHAQKQKYINELEKFFKQVSMDQMKS